MFDAILHFINVTKDIVKIWLDNHPYILLSLICFSIVSFLASIFLFPILVKRAPKNMLLQISDGTDSNFKPMALIWWAKTFVGLILLILGIAMIFLPGPGIIVILISFLLLQFPGKHWLVRKIICFPKMISVLNLLRKRYGVEPFEWP